MQRFFVAENVACGLIDHLSPGKTQGTLSEAITISPTRRVLPLRLYPAAQ
jgi:hypothetical protein